MTPAGRNTLVVTLLIAAIVVGALVWLLPGDRRALAAPHVESGANARAEVSEHADAHALAQSGDTAPKLDETFWNALDTAQKPTFEEKYTGLDTRVLELAHERVAARLETSSAAVFDALAAAGATKRVRTQPGAEPAPSEGSLARRATPVWQPYGITEFDVVEFDRATQAETSALWAELTWLEAHIPQ